MYMTEQRKKLFAFFRARPDVNLSAKDIVRAVQESGGTPVSVSAVYRNLDKMEKAGLLIRSAGRTSRESLYRYVSDNHCDNKLHLTCLKCGKTIHMNSRISDILYKEVLSSDDFSIDASRTTLYGWCKKCR